MQHPLQQLADGQAMPQVSYTVTANDLMELMSLMMERMEREKEKAVEASREIPTLTPGEVAEMLKVNKTTLWRWDKSGHLKSVRIGGRALYRKSDIDALLAQGQKSNI